MQCGFALLHPTATAYLVTPQNATLSPPFSARISRGRSITCVATLPVRLSFTAMEIRRVSGRIFIGDAPVEEGQLPSIFAARRAAARGDGPPVFLRADRTLDYGRVMRVMGELNRAGLNKVSLVTTSADSTQ